MGIIRNGVDLHPMGFLLDVIFHFCPPMGTIKTMVFHLSTLWVLLGPWFSVFPENSQAKIHSEACLVLLRPWFFI